MGDDKEMESASNNDQLVRTVPGTDVGGHDTAGVDGEKRTERPGELLGTPNSEASDNTKKARETAVSQADHIAKSVDFTNREVLPRLGGEAAAEEWEADEPGVPEFLAGAKIIKPKAAEKK